jgi:hypothetical protein
VSADAGKTFSAKYSGGAMLGFALSPDGSKVYLGGASDGLQVASVSDFAFRQTSSVPVQCLRTSGTTLYVCSDEMTAGFTLGASTDDGAMIVPQLHVQNVRGPLACAPSSSTAACVAGWPALQQVLGGISTPPPVDAGGATEAGSATDAGDASVRETGGDAQAPGDAPGGADDAGAGPPPAPVASSGSGCSVAGVPVAAGDGAALVVAALYFARKLSSRAARSSRRSRGRPR